MTILWILGGLFVLGVAYGIGVRAGVRRTKKALQEAYDLGVEDGQKALTQNAYRQEAPIVYRPPTAFEKLAASMARMVASYGVGISEVAKQLDAIERGMRNGTDD